MSWWTGSITAHGSAKACRRTAAATTIVTFRSSIEPAHRQGLHRADTWAARVALGEPRSVGGRKLVNDMRPGLEQGRVDPGARLRFCARGGAFTGELAAGTPRVGPSAPSVLAHVCSHVRAR